MKLYITPGSPYARMARIVVLEKQLGSRVEVIFAKTRTKGSEYYSAARMVGLWEAEIAHPVMNGRGA